MAILDLWVGYNGSCCAFEYCQCILQLSDAREFSTIGDEGCRSLDFWSH